MSVEEGKIKCSYCNAFLFPEDDVVFCPTCGAPHHRECYNEIGHCALEEKHGTEEQYDTEKNSAVIEPDTSNQDTSGRIRCGMCGNMYAEDLPSCPECNTPNIKKMKGMPFGFDFLGGVPGNLDLGDGVKADEAKQFVMTNSQRFIPKFAANKVGKKASFNLLAFLFPGPWMLCRKMYKSGALVVALEVVASLLSVPFMSAVGSNMSDNMVSYDQIYTFILKNMDKIGIPAMVSLGISAAILLLVRVVVGIFGDLFYRNHCISTIKMLKAESQDYEADIRKKGGTNFILFLVGLLTVDYLPQILVWLMDML